MNPAQPEAQGQAVMMAGVIELVLAAISVLVVVNWRRAAHGDLGRNAYVGLRTPSTMRNEQSWVAGNRAAARSAPLYLLFNAAMSAFLFAAAWQGWRFVVAFLGGAGFFALIGLMIGTAVISGRAARAAGGPADRRGALSHSLQTPDLNAPFSGRTMTIVGWVCAVIACGIAIFILGNITDGYVLAIHQQLQPNATFGFRDRVAFSCLPRWYAAQKAGFSWLLFGYGPVVVGCLLVCAAAAIKRRSPWGICALVIVTLCLAVVFVVAAGIHADSVARAITC